MLIQRMSFYERNRETILMLINLAIFMISAWFAYRAEHPATILFWMGSTAASALIILIRILSWNYWVD